MARTKDNDTSIHRDHRRVIDDASKDIHSRVFMQRTNAIRTLIGLLERPEVNIYHKALISNLLAHAGDDDGLEVDEYAYECIALCNKIITHEDLAEGSNARQPFDDMITRARDMLKALSDDEDRTRTALEARLAELESGMDVDMTDESGDNDDDDGNGDDINETGDGDNVSDEEGYDLDEGDQADDEHGGEEILEIADAPQRISGDNSSNVVGYVSMVENNPDSNALASRITRDPGFEPGQESGGGYEWQCEIELEDAELIRCFVILLLQNRMAMEGYLREYAHRRGITDADLNAETPARNFLEGLSFRIKPDATIPESEDETSEPT